MDVTTAVTSPAVGDLITAGNMDTVAADIAALSARVGALVTTNAAQAVSASTQTNANNGGSAAWTSSFDSGSFVSGTGGTTTPITIATGKGGLYIVGFGINMSSAATTRGFAQVMLGGSFLHNMRAVFTSDNITGGMFTVGLTAGTTIGLAVFNNIACNLQVGTELYCYRIGD